MRWWMLKGRGTREGKGVRAPRLKATPASFGHDIL